MYVLCSNSEAEMVSAVHLTITLEITIMIEIEQEVKTMWNDDVVKANHEAKFSNSDLPGTEMFWGLVFNLNNETQCSSY